MATVIREIAVSAPASQCWDALRDFGALHERLVTGFVTDAVEGPMGSTHHNASAQIVPAGPEQCRIVWITDVLPDQIAERTAGLMEAGLKAMKSTLDGAVTPA